MKEVLTSEFLEKATNPLYLVAKNMSDYVIQIIAERIKECGTLTPSDVNRLRNTMRIADFKKIEEAVAEYTEKSVAEVDGILHGVARENESMAQTWYEYRGVKQVKHEQNAVLNKIVKASIKNARADVLALSNTTAWGLKVGQTVIPYKQAYNRIIDNVSFALNQGVVDYNTAIRRTLKQVAGNGVRVVYDSGATRRLDSAVRMNIMDGCRQMSLDFREQQAKEYKADGWEISAHPLSRPEHQNVQGKVYSLKEFEKLNEELDTPIATGEMNCRHTKVGVIMAINQPAYDEEELKRFAADSNKQITFNGLSGRKTTMSKYDCSQYLRSVETKARDKRAEVEAFKTSGDVQGKKAAEKEYTDIVREYHRIARETGIKADLSRI